MQEQTKQIVAKIWKAVEPVLRSEQIELVEVEYRREPQGWVLRLYIDQDDGITMEDCVRVNHLVSDLLDVVDPIPHPYHLEISSPGLDRPLRKLEHFAKQIGNVVQIVVHEPVSGRRRFKGILLRAEPEEIALKCGEDVYTIPLPNVERARLRFFESKVGRS